MANVAAAGAKLSLDWLLGGATPTQPASRLGALCSGLPTSVSASEYSSGGNGYARQTVLFGAAASPAGSASNTAAMTWGPFSSSGVVLGFYLLDNTNLANTTGGQILYGSLLTARTPLPGDTFFISAGQLIITMA